MQAHCQRHTADEEHRLREAALDRTIEDSFPASDPPSSIPNPDADEPDHSRHVREVRGAEDLSENAAQGRVTMPASTVRPLRHILLPVDLAEPAEAAIVQAHQWAQRFDAAIDVLYVAHEGDSGDAQTVTAPRGDQVVLRDLGRLIERLVPDHVPRCQVLVRRGRAAPTIRYTAASTDADLVVMGSHGRTRVGRWVLGSVAAEVLRDAVIPVVIVKEPPSSLDQATWVVAVDFSDASEAALHYAGRLAAHCGASLCLVHALPIGEHQSAGHAIMREMTRKALQDLLERHVPSTVGSRIHVEMSMGPTAKAIAHYAGTARASLIVMGAHGRSGWAAGILGSVTDRVIHETPAPVLVVRPGRAGFP